MSASTQTAKPQSKLARYFPILAWLPHYDRSWLSMDVLAGLTLWGLVVPEAMAYAGIAGLPPQAGLYTLVAALLVYALLGTSRHLVVQATSATAALLFLLPRLRKKLPAGLVVLFGAIILSMVFDFEGNYGVEVVGTPPQGLPSLTLLQVPWTTYLALAGVLLIDVLLIDVLLIDVLQGMVIGFIASLVYVIYQSSRPHVSSLGRVPGVPGGYSDLTRHPENTPVPGMLIVRLDGVLYFANALTVRARVKAMIEEMQPPPHSIIFDASAQDSLDLTSSDVLKSLVKELQGRGMAVTIADVHALVREFGRKTGLLELIGEERLFPTVELAVQQAEATLQAAQAEG